MSSQRESRRYDAFIAKLNRSSNAIPLAEEFSRGFAHNLEGANVYLTDIIFKCCRMAALPPVDLIREGRFDELKAFAEDAVERRATDTVAFAGYDTCFEKYWYNLLSFFERVISLMRRDLSGDCDFNTYLAKLLAALGESNVPSVRHLSVMIRLKFVTALAKTLQGRPVTARRAIRRYAVCTLRYAHYDADRRIWHHSLRELGDWLLLSDHFLHRRYLRYIDWSVRDKETKVTQLALEISCALLANSSSDRLARLRSELFVRRIVDSCAFAARTTKNKIFEMACECSCVVRERLAASCAELLPVVRDNVFAEDGVRAKMAAKFLARLEFGSDRSDVETLRAIVASLSGRNVDAVELLADAFVDVFDVLTDWSLLANVLFDKTDPEPASPLSAAERETLLCLVLCVVTQSLTGRRPRVKSSRGSADRTRAEWRKLPRARNTSKQITAAFGTVFKDAVRVLDGAHGPRSQMLLMKIMTFFDFDSMAAEHVVIVMSMCMHPFERPNPNETRMRVAMELLVNIVRCSTDERVRMVIREGEPIAGLKSHFQTRFATVVGNLLENPHVRAEDAAFTQESAVGLYVVSLAESPDRAYALDLPLKLLKYELTPWSAAFVLVREIGILLCNTYVNWRFDELLDNEREPDDGTSRREFLDDVQRIQHVYDVQLNLYFVGRLGQPIFFSLCNMAKKLVQLYPPPNDSLLDTLKEKMAAYVAVIVCGHAAEVLPSVPVDDVTKKDILTAYFELIELNVLPLPYACDVLDSYCKWCDVFEKPLQRLLVAACRRREPSDVARCVMEFLVYKFGKAVDEEDWQGLVALARRLARLICPVKKELAPATRLLHTDGIDYACADVDDAAWTPVKFLYLLAELSVCLNAADRTAVYRYVLKKKATNVEIMRHYVRSLKRTRPVDEKTEVEDSESSSQMSFPDQADANNDTRSDRASCAEEPVSEPTDTPAPMPGSLDVLPSSSASVVSSESFSSSDWRSGGMRENDFDEDACLPNLPETSDDDSAASVDGSPAPAKKRFKGLS